MNKKFLLIFIVLGVPMVLALGYFTLFTATFGTVLAAIDGTPIEQEIPSEVYTGEVYRGSSNDITNDAPSAREIELIDDGGLCDITTKYVSTLGLTKKVVAFGEPNWTWIAGGEVEVEYTVVGSEFSAEVIGEGIEGYVLVYYADNDDRFANPGETVLVENVAGNLPGVDDKNANLNDYSLEYPTTPHGAKIWYVPETAVPNGVVDWTRANEFLFETNLIEYNAEGQITIYSGQTLTVTPLYLIGEGTTSGCIVTTTVA